jgi:hypothetical protein
MLLDSGSEPRAIFTLAINGRSFMKNTISPCLFGMAMVAACVGTSQVAAELVLIPATDMSGIESWKEGQSWGAGNFWSTDGSSVSTVVKLAGGEYAVYARIFTSPVTDAGIHVRVNEKLLIPPMQAKVHKLGWVRLAPVKLPQGEVSIRVEPPTPGQASDHNFAAIALCSSPLDDRVARIMGFSDWLRHELIRMEVPRPPSNSLQEAQSRIQARRHVLLDTLGLDPLPPRTPLNARLTGRLEKDDYVIEKVAFESRPNHVVPALLYLPKNARGPLPAVISAIGHWCCGKSSVAPQRRGIALAKQGYAVLSLEACYAWERGIPGNSEGFQPFVAGGTIAGHMVWDIMRGVDYLESRADIDASKLAVTGASGGGLQTFYAGVVDERFKVVMPAVALWSMPELAVNFYYSCDNWVPGISRMGGMGELIAMTAPRAMLVMNVDADYSTSHAAEIMVNAARPYYRLLAADSKLLHTVEKGGHDYTRRMRETTISFLDRWLKGTGDGFPVSEEDCEDELFDEQAPDLYVFDGGKIPAADAETVTSFWTAQSIALREKLPDDPPNLAARVRHLLNMPPVSGHHAVPTDRGFVLTTDPGVEVAVMRMGSGPQAVIWLGESDFDTESRRPEVQAMAKESSVFVLEPRGAGMPGEMHILRHAPIVMGRPLVGMWAYDLLCAVDYLCQQRRYESVRVCARGYEMGLACLLATLQDERIASAAIDRMFSSFVQLVGHGSPTPQIPGILKLADVVHLAGAVDQDRIRFNNLRMSKWAGDLQSTDLPPPEFFSKWLRSAGK